MLVTLAGDVPAQGGQHADNSRVQAPRLLDRGVLENGQSLGLSVAHVADSLDLGADAAPRAGVSLGAGDRSADGRADAGGAGAVRGGNEPLVVLRLLGALPGGSDALLLHVRAPSVLGVPEESRDAPIGDNAAAATWAYYGNLHVRNEAERPDGHMGQSELLLPRNPGPPVPGAGQRGAIDGTATHYGESYNGQPLRCGTGVYDSGDPHIVAVAPSRYGQWPCGAVLHVRGPSGEIEVTREDGCPGCDHDQLDLSEAGFIAVCGDLTQGRCAVTIQEE